MKRIDFNYEGGFPLTQNDLATIQDGAQEGINALAGAGGAESYIIRGMEVTGDDPLFTVAPGWVYHNGGVYACLGGDVATSGFATIGFELTEEHDEVDNLETFLDGNEHVVRSNLLARPVECAVDAEETETFFKLSVLHRARLPYDLPAPEPEPEYEYFADSKDVTVDSVCDISIFFKQRRHIATGLVDNGIYVRIDNGADSISVAAPNMRIVDTLIDVEFMPYGCASVFEHTFLVPVQMDHSGSSMVAVLDSSSVPIRHVAVSLKKDGSPRLYVGITKTATVYSYEAGGMFQFIDSDDAYEGGGVFEG